MSTTRAVSIGLQQWPFPVSFPIRYCCVTELLRPTVSASPTNTNGLKLALKVGFGQQT